MMLNLEDTLKAYGLTKDQISKYIVIYNAAIKKNIPYPHYYTMTKLFI